MNAFAESIIAEYMQQIFYFSLKKTSGTYEAEELTQEIMLEIIKSTDRGSKPTDTKAWVWKLARNRYARWTQRRKRERALCDIDSFSEVIPDGGEVEDSIIKREEISLLRRELSLLAYEHRNIVCEYYFANRSLSDIASSLALPLGTVKYKIFECRKNLKEGMKMSRTYGKRSFAPEDVDFYMNWNPDAGNNGYHYVERSAPANILLEAYDNPCTAQELSLALGIAMPYMEEEIRLLLDGELLLKDGDRYKTNIVILSKETQDELYDMSNEFADRLAPLVMRAVDELAGKPELPQNQCFEDMKPTLMTLLLENIPSPDKQTYSAVHTIKHNDGSEWALIGMVKTDKHPLYLEEYGNEFYDQIIALGNRSDRLSPDLTDVPTFTRAAIDSLFKTECNAEIIAMLTEFEAKQNAVMKRDIPKYLYENAMFFASADLRRLCLDRAVECGYISLHEDMNRSAMGIWRFQR